MMLPAFWNDAWTAALANHLWQSTVVTGIAWLLSLSLRKNHARMRFWVWMIASVKYLIPFSLLIAARESLRSAFATPIQRPLLAAAMEQITLPFSQVAPPAAVSFASATPEAASLSFGYVLVDARVVADPCLYSRLFTHDAAGRGAGFLLVIPDRTRHLRYLPPRSAAAAGH
jgi:hypothetical protein